ncbi:single-stranded-DNA-specific exonuclease RecJ [Pseudochelatococcus lubricantis]|nr:single-stranded-DNA-specific exonuclease RecJ [Pseudochelatococcus lubricantis]
MVQLHGLPDILARVLASRGIGPDDAQAYLAPRVRDLMPDPSTLVAMDEAAARIARAVARREKVAILGDYDVDGACSSALLGLFLARGGVDFVVRIPDRVVDGYGPNLAAIRELHEAGCTLLVTVDCGVASFEPLAEARRLGMDVVVLDHHQAGVELPQAVAVVNPNRQDDLSGLGHLCAAGVVFMALVAVQRALRQAGFWRQTAGGEPDLLADLDLVALATVADVVPLVGLNRAFVQQGLAVMRQRRRPGLTALLDVSGLSGPPEAWHLGFLLGPRINAGGRIGDSALGTTLLMAREPHEAARIATELNTLNAERQVVERLAVEEAVAMAERQLAEGDPPVLVVASPGWHPGVVGLVAARVKERFNRPAFAIALDDRGGGTGSGRSIPGADIGRAVRRMVEEGIAVKGGGHAMAAGVTLGRDGVAAFGERLSAVLAEDVGRAGEGEALGINAALTAGGATPELVAGISRAGPYGAGNPEPVFAFGHHMLTEATVVGANHVRVRLRAGDGASLGGMVFRAADQPLGQALLSLKGQPVHAAGTLALDNWGGRTQVSLRLLDVCKAEAARR